MQGYMVLAGIIGAIVGSIPTVLIIAKLFNIANVRAIGRSEDDAENSARYNGVGEIYSIAGLTPALVLCLCDALKGMSAAWLGFQLTQTFSGALVATVFAQFLHAANPFMMVRSEHGREFMGGRGVPVVLGAFFVINPVPIGTFIAVWLTGYFVIYRHSVVGNVSGAIGTILLIFSAPEMFLTMFMRLPIEAITQFRVGVFLSMMHIIIRHLPPVRVMMAQNRDEF